MHLADQLAGLICMLFQQTFEVKQELTHLDGGALR
jgi:hypothetical protein